MATVELIFKRYQSARVTSHVLHLERILAETTVGDPMSHLKWTCKSTRDIAKVLGGAAGGPPQTARAP